MTSNDNGLSEHRWRFSDVAEEPRRMLPPIQGYENKPLVPLEEAVEPLVEHVPNVRRYALLAKKECKIPPADGLSIDESASIRLYTMEWKPKGQSLYSVLNKDLRSEDRDLLKNWFLYLKLVITALSKIPSTSRLLYRGVKLDLSREHPPGRNTVWWAFSSCTTSMKVLENETFYGKTGTRTLFKIGCYSGKDIHQHSFYPKEHEVLLFAATEFRIVASFHTSDDVHIIHLKETEPEFPLIVKQNLVIPSPPLSVEQIIVEQPTAQPVYHNSDLQSRIAGCPSCSTVNLGEQRLTDEDMRIVVEQAIIGKRCTKLFLQSNLWTSQGISTLAEGLCESTTLEELNLSNNLLTDMDLTPLTQGLLKSRVVREKQYSCCRIGKFKELDTLPIKTLDLSYNNIGDEGAKSLANLITDKRTLTHLHLNDNRISNDGVQLLANALSRPTTTLLKLYLHNNTFITDLSVNYLVDMLQQNRSLETLWLINCNLTNAGRNQLRQAVASKRGFYLNVEMFE